jgi:hypothetical protein
LCEGYCNTVLTGCNQTGNYQYTDRTNCLAHCATFPKSNTVQVLGTTSGNFLECRQYHAIVALTGDAAAKTLHCPHAGPVGTGSYTTPYCGTHCEGYCNGLQAACGTSGANMQFATTAACLAACANYSTTGTPGTSTGNTFQCRAYHAFVALNGDAAAKTLHCPHAGQSPTQFCIAGSTSSSSSSTSSMTGSSTAVTGTNGAAGVSASATLVAALVAAVAIAKQL